MIESCDALIAIGAMLRPSRLLDRTRSTEKMRLVELMIVVEHETRRMGVTRIDDAGLTTGAGEEGGEIRDHRQYDQRRVIGGGRDIRELTIEEEQSVATCGQQAARQQQHRHVSDLMSSGDSALHTSPLLSSCSLVAVCTALLSAFISRRVPTYH